MAFSWCLRRVSGGDETDSGRRSSGPALAYLKSRLKVLAAGLSPARVGQGAPGSAVPDGMGAGGLGAVVSGAAGGGRAVQHRRAAAAGDGARGRRRPRCRRRPRLGARACAGGPARAGRVRSPPRRARPTSLRPAGSSTSTLQPTSGAATVDVLACTTAWSTTGQCPGRAGRRRPTGRAQRGRATALALPAGTFRTCGCRCAAERWPWAQVAAASADTLLEAGLRLGVSRSCARCLL